MKKALHILFLCVLVLCLQTTASAAFDDVPSDHWARNYINEMTGDGILSGYADGTFLPDKTMTRAEFATVLAKIAGLEPRGAASPYTDISNHWAKEYILAASPYINGISDALFAPDEPATREVVASVLGGIMGGTIPSVDVSAAQAKFSDFGDADPEFQADIVRAVKLGITGGYPDGTFRPKAALTRAEVCAFVYRTFRYEIDTVASNLYDFRSMIVDDDGIAYYIDGSTLYNTGTDKTLDLNTSFGESLSNPYLAYDAYHDIVYLLAGGDLTVHDITDFDHPVLVLDKMNCPALLKSGAGKLEYCSSVTPQIAVLENGALLIPFDTNGTWMVNPQNMTVTKTSRLYSFSYPNQYAKVVGDTVIVLDESRKTATLTPIGQDQGQQVSLPGVPGNNANSVSSRNGFLYFYSEAAGVCGYYIAPDEYFIYFLMGRENIKVKDYYGLENMNIWCLDASENDHVAFYDNTLKCIRCIHHAS